VKALGSIPSTKKKKERKKRKRKILKQPEKNYRRPKNNKTTNLRLLNDNKESQKTQV
jgi:hypothetical protein